MSGSNLGGGIFGALVVLDGSGQEIAVLIVGSELNHFDSRGLFFPDNQTLLIVAADPIFLATPQDFQATPEPTTLLLGSGLDGAMGVIRRKIKL